MKKRISVLMLIIVFIIMGIPAFALETPGSNTLPEGFYLAVPGGEAELSVGPRRFGESSGSFCRRRQTRQRWTCGRRKKG